MTKFAWVVAILAAAIWAPLVLMWAIGRVDEARRDRRHVALERERLELDRLAMLPINPCPWCEGSGEAMTEPLPRREVA